MIRRMTEPLTERDLAVFFFHAGLNHFLGTIGAPLGSLSQPTLNSLSLAEWQLCFISNIKRAP
jgi:hypothetical protein